MVVKKKKTSKNIKKTSDISFDDIPQLAVVTELEQELGVSPAFFQALLAEDDWSFVIKLHSLLEAAVTHLLTTILEKPELRDIMSRLELSNNTTGKLAFAKSLDLLSSDVRRFIQKLSELRNKMVHDVANVSINLESYFLFMNANDRKGYYTAFKWGHNDVSTVKVKVSENEIDLHELVKFLAISVMKNSHKLGIWLGTIIVLRLIHDKLSSKKYEREVRELSLELASLIEVLIPQKFQELEVDDGQ